MNFLFSPFAQSMCPALSSFSYFFRLIIFFHSGYFSIRWTLASLLPYTYSSSAFFVLLFARSFFLSILTVPWVYPPFMLYCFLLSFMSLLFVHLCLHLQLALLHSLLTHPSLCPHSLQSVLPSFLDPFLADIIMSSQMRCKHTRNHRSKSLSGCAECINP